MRKPKPDNEFTELPFLSPDRADIPELDKFFTGLDDVDDLLREVASLPGPDDLVASTPSIAASSLLGDILSFNTDDLVASTPSIAADRATLIGLDDAEQAVSRMLGMYATRKPPRRCHRPRRRRAKP